VANCALAARCGGGEEARRLACTEAARGCSASAAGSVASGEGTRPAPVDGRLIAGSGPPLLALRPSAGSTDGRNTLLPLPEPPRSPGGDARSEANSLSWSLVKARLAEARSRPSSLIRPSPERFPPLSSEAGALSAPSPSTSAAKRTTSVQILRNRSRSWVTASNESSKRRTWSGEQPSSSRTVLTC